MWGYSVNFRQKFCFHFTLVPFNALLLSTAMSQLPIHIPPQGQPAHLYCVKSRSCTMVALLEADGGAPVQINKLYKVCT